MDLSSTIYTHLGQVNDPEIPVLSLHDMGILRGVNVLPETDERHAQAHVYPTKNPHIVKAQYRNLRIVDLTEMRVYGTA